MRMLAVAVALAMSIAACSSAPPAASVTSVTLQPETNAVIEFRGGRYRFTWDFADCTAYFLAIVSETGGARIDIPVPAATGSIEMDVSAGPARIDRGGECPSGKYTVTIERLSGPSPAAS
jgi:hypothetical protein